MWYIFVIIQGKANYGPGMTCRIREPIIQFTDLIVPKFVSFIPVSTIDQGELNLHINIIPAFNQPTMTRSLMEFT